MLNTVTITGADDNTPISWILDMSDKYPFVEWAILVSSRLEGSRRFPSRGWCSAFSQRVASRGMDGRSTAVSMHVCGQWVRDLLRGRLDWNSLPEVRIVADRVQVNTHAEELISTSRMMDQIEVLYGKQFIVQLDGVNDHLFDAAWERKLNVSGLFDCSHGAGVLPKDWPTPRDHSRYYGYAGGLGPENVVEQIENIRIARRNLDFWIDMEGRVRDGMERLDLAKVERVLHLCKPLVGVES